MQLSSSGRIQLLPTSACQPMAAHLWRWTECPYSRRTLHTSSDASRRTQTWGYVLTDICSPRCFNKSEFSAPASWCNLTPA